MESFGNRLQSRFKINGRGRVQSVEAPPTVAGLPRQCHVIHDIFHFMSSVSGHANDLYITGYHICNHNINPKINLRTFRRNRKVSLRAFPFPLKPLCSYLTVLVMDDSKLSILPDLKRDCLCIPWRHNIFLALTFGKSCYRISFPPTHIFIR